MKRIIVTAVLTALALSGCTDSMGQKEQMGTLVGGAAGALAGSQFGKGHGRLAATAIGTLLGAALGQNVGSSLDDLDRMKAQQAFNTAATAPVGQTIHWDNPKSGHSGSVMTTREGKTDAGEYCREFQTAVKVGGSAQTAYGTACRQPDGSWKMSQ